MGKGEEYSEAAGEEEEEGAGHKVDDGYSLCSTIRTWSPYHGEGKVTL